MKVSKIGLSRPNFRNLIILKDQIFMIKQIFENKYLKTTPKIYDQMLV